MLAFVHWYGTRFWLKLGTAICGVSMFILAICVRQMPTPDSASAGSGFPLGGMVSVAMVYIFAFSFGTSLGPLSWNICSEIFPAHIKTACCAITTVTQWLFQIVISTITPHLLSRVGWATYVLYALFCAISYLWVDYCVPETKDVPLGKAMDGLFDASGKPSETFMEESETTPLLARARVRERRESIGFPV